MLFFTGFPGFLGSELIRDLLPKYPQSKALCLVQDKFLSLARQHLAAFPEGIRHRVQLVSGDITLPALGLAPEFFEKQSAEITQIFHLAAVYDLNVKKEVGMKINVEGTKNMLAFAKQCPNLQRFEYVSTCYVSGRLPGTFTEKDLVRGQRFNNHYEYTKYLAEIEVQKAMKEGLHCTIYRPGIVVGNSHTGETQKFDGPYFVLQWLMRQPKIAILPKIFAHDCASGDCTLDLVPSDFVIQAIAYLSQKPEAKNHVFQLADPTPLRIPEIIQEFGRVLHQKIISIPMPLGLARWALRFIPFLEKWIGVPHSALNYFAHPTHYDTSNTLSQLKGSGIVIPHFRVYLPHLVHFMRTHRDTRSKAMV